MLSRMTVALGDPKFWKLEHCCFGWDLKAGAIISTVIGFTVIFAALINVTSQFKLLYREMEDEDETITTYRGYQAIHFSLTYVYLLLGLTAFAIAFVGAYTGHYVLTIIGTCFTVATFIFWIALTVLSYLPDYYRIVCIQSRCPDLHWFVEGRWRDFGFNNCQILGANIGGEQLPPKAPPASVPYPRWFTARSFYRITNLNQIYLDYFAHKHHGFKMIEPKPKMIEPKLKQIEDYNNITDRNYKSMPAREVNVISSKRIDKTNRTSTRTSTISRNKNRNKKNQPKRNKRRKKHRKASRRKFRTKAKSLKKKYKRADEDEEYEDEGEGSDLPTYKKLGKYIPLNKLAQEVEDRFKGASIFLAVLWGVFMLNTVFVLIYYWILLYSELPFGEEEGEGEMEA